MVFVMADPVQRAGNVRIDAGLAELEGELLSPLHPAGLVILPAVGQDEHAIAHEVAAALQPQGLAALRADLLTPAERGHDECCGDLGSDRGFLAERISGIATWAQEHFVPGSSGGHRVGCFASGATADAAALAAADISTGVGALALYRGRFEPAGSAMHSLAVPLLIVADMAEPPDAAPIAAAWLAACLVPARRSLGDLRRAA